jgi:hypothetical protein
MKTLDDMPANAVPAAGDVGGPVAPTHGMPGAAPTRYESGCVAAVGDGVDGPQYTAPEVASVIVNVGSYPRYTPPVLQMKSGLTTWQWAELINKHVGGDVALPAHDTLTVVSLIWNTDDPVPS